MRNPWRTLPLGAVFDFPAEHWIPLRATNPMESTFSTVRLRTRGAAALAMVLKLIESAQQRWRGRVVNAAHLVPPAQLHVPGHIACQFVLSNDVPGWAVYWSVRVIVESRGWCSIGHFGLMVVTIPVGCPSLRGEMGNPCGAPVLRCAVRFGASLCPGVQAVIRFAYSGAVRRGPRWEFLGGPLS